MENNIEDLEQDTYTYLKWLYDKHKKGGIWDDYGTGSPEEINYFNKIERNGYLEVVKKDNKCIFYHLTDKTESLINKYKDNPTQYRNIKFIRDEKQLENMIVSKLSIVEDGLILIDRQLPIKDGVIDILGKDKNGVICIIELKTRKNDQKLVFQSAYYPTQFKEKVRMITIAPDYSRKIYLSLNNLKNIERKAFKIMKPVEDRTVPNLHIYDFKM